jgi:hypothetical protein
VGRLRAAQIGSQVNPCRRGSCLAELGKERGAPFHEGGELGAELFELAIDAGQFGTRLKQPWDEHVVV